MRSIITVIILFACSIVSNIATGQHTWLWAESIDRSSTWNEPFYKTYNTVDKLLSLRADSAHYCTDCSLANLLLKGIEANKIAIYQLDKKSKLSIQKLNTIQTTFLTQTTHVVAFNNIRDALALSEIIIYRRPDTTNSSKLSALPIEWIALKIPFEKDTVSIYLKSNACFAYLKENECKWVHPLNHHVRLTMGDAIMQRNYIIGGFNIVSAYNLKIVPDYKINLPLLAQTFHNNDTHTSTGSLDINKDTLLIRLQAIFSADITSNYNKGFNKAHIVDFLLQLHVENKIKGYSYHEAGYFTVLEPKDLSNHLLVETIDEGDITIKRLPSAALTQMHTLKTYTKISGADRITNDWLIFGLSEETSTAFNNRYAIAFKYEDVLAALATTKYMWYHSTNQKDSCRLDQALQKQYIDYNALTICSVYGDTISSEHYDSYANFANSVSRLLSEYTPAFLLDFAEFQEITRRNANLVLIETYKLSYAFTAENNTVLTKNTLLVDALLDGIRTNKLQVYKDVNLTRVTNASWVLNKLDKTRFYKTGNRKKDSIYISKIPLEERFIKSSDLKEFTLSSNYTILKKKSTNQGISFGIFIPAELNPQYESDTLCYVSFNECVTFLKKNKAYKTLSVQFLSLLNERGIVFVEDFYDLPVYDATDENAVVPDYLPLYIRERIMK